MLHKVGKNVARKKRHLRNRKKITGSAEKPRLNVYRSLSNIYVQIIDDVEGKTIVSASSLDKEVKEQFTYCGNIEAATVVGKLVAKRALEKGITTVVYDRGGCIYHGRIAAVANGAREEGLKF